MSKKKFVANDVSLAEEFLDTTRNPVKGNEFDFYKDNGIIKGENGWELTHGFNDVIREDVLDLMKLYSNCVFPEWIQAHKDYCLYSGDRAEELRKLNQDWRTNIKQPIQRGYVDRCHRPIYTSKISTNIIPIGDSARTARATDQIQSSLDRCAHGAKLKDNIYDWSFDLALCGVGYVRSNFKTPKTVEGYYLDSPAQCDYVSNFNLFADLFIPFYQQRRIVYRKIMTADEAFKKIKIFTDALQLEEISQEKKDIICRNPKVFSEKNYDNVRLIRKFGSLASAVTGNGTAGQQDILSQNFKSQGIVEYIEVWFEKELYIFINGYRPIPKIPNPRSGKKICFHPFKVASHSRIPGTWMSDGPGVILGGIQSQYDSMYNMMFDSAKFNTAPMIIPAPGQQFPAGASIPYVPYGFLKIDGQNVGELKKWSLADGLDTSQFRLAIDMINSVNNIIAPTSYNQVAGQSRSATDSQYRFEGLEDSIKSQVASISKALSMIYDEWILGMVEKMPSEFNIPVLGDGKKEMKKINKEEIEGNYIFEFEFDSVREFNKMIERQQAEEFVNSILKIDNGDQGYSYVDRPNLLKWVMKKHGVPVEDMFVDGKEAKDKAVGLEKMKIDIESEVIAYRKEKIPEPFVPGGDVTNDQNVPEPVEEVAQPGPVGIEAGSKVISQEGMDMARMLKEVTAG